MWRSITGRLLAWKDEKDRKPLLLTGVRQCGKTYAVKDFGAAYFPDVAYYNFEENENLRDIFEWDFNVERIVDELGSLARGKKICVGRTLVILDEIQACPKAVAAMEYFYENMGELHIVCIGSLLQAALQREQVSFPAEKVDWVKMYPMTFSEFLMADGKEELVKQMERRSGKEPVEDTCKFSLEADFKIYFAVGGMPEAVATWLEFKDMGRVERIQEAILSGYANDFVRRAPKKEIMKLHWVWDSVPRQMLKENNKFLFSQVREGKKAAELKAALQWLIDAGLLYRIERVENPEVPLDFCADKAYFKVYMCDVGLFRKKANIPVSALWEESGGYKEFRTAMTDIYCMEELTAMGFSPYFWRSGNTAEVDFLVECQGQLIPMETKGELHTRAKNYRAFCAKYRPKLGFHLTVDAAGEEEDQTTRHVNLPLYLLWGIGKYL